MVLLWLVFNAAWAVVATGAQLWVMGALPILPAPLPDLAPITEPWRTGSVFVGLSWPVAYVALVLGHRRVALIATVLGVAANAGAIVLSMNDLAWNLSALSLGLLVMFGVDVCLIGAVWTFAPRWSPIRPGPWWLGLIGSVAAVTVLMVGAIVEVLPWWTLDPVNVGAVAVLAMVVVRLVAGANPSWSLALAVLIWGVLGLRVCTLIDVVDTRPWAGYSPIAFALAEIAALLIAALPTTLLALRAQSRLASVR